MNQISFPGLGLGPITTDGVAFTVFGHDIMWYGIIIAVGMVLAFFYAWTRAKFEGVKTDDLIDLGLFIIIFGIIGARLYYVIFTFDQYVATGGNFMSNLGQTLLNIVSIWNGGLAIFGGIIAGFFAALLVARRKKIHFPVILDILAPSVMIGQILGRWGNFFNAEAYGRETTLPWRMRIERISAGGLYTTSTEVHPTFLYESLWNLIGFVLIAIFYKKKKFNGQVFYFYMIWYGAGRAFIEGLRTDSLLIAGNPNLRVSQILAALVCIAGIVLMTLGYSRLKKKESGNTAASSCITAESGCKSCTDNMPDPEKPDITPDSVPEDAPDEYNETGNTQKEDK